MKKRRKINEWIEMLLRFVYYTFEIGANYESQELSLLKIVISSSEKKKKRDRLIGDSVEGCINTRINEKNRTTNLFVRSPDFIYTSTEIRITNEMIGKIYERSRCRLTISISGLISRDTPSLPSLDLHLQASVDHARGRWCKTAHQSCSQLRTFEIVFEQISYGVRSSDLILLQQGRDRNNITKESLLSIRVGEPNTNPDVSSYPSSCTRLFHGPIPQSPSNLPPSPIGSKLIQLPKMQRCTLPVRCREEYHHSRGWFRVYLHLSVSPLLSFFLLTTLRTGTYSRYGGNNPLNDSLSI